jgi:hypothetical protein
LKESYVDKTYTLPEFKQRLAKHIQGMIERVANDIQDLTKREFVRDGLMKADIMGAAHFEPGSHEPAQVGVPEHMEPGSHEQFALNPPAGPDASASSTVGGGNGIPGGQINQDTCPLCKQPDVPGICTCLDDYALGKKEFGKNASEGYGSTPQNDLAMSEALCKSCGKSHKGACSMEKGEMEGKGSVTKQVPTKPVPGAVLPPAEGGEKVKNKGDDNKPKKNALGKAAVPEAKPPSGKVPGGTGAAPMASNTSKPGITKSNEPMEKGALNPQMKQHAIIDASKQAAGAAAPTAMAGAMKAPPAPGLTNPNDMSRANAHTQAMGGAFQPKGPINSGLELDTKPKAGLMAPPKGAMAPGIGGPMKTPALGGAKPKPSPFGKSEKCPFCNNTEHPGDCTAK